MIGFVWLSTWHGGGWRGGGASDLCVVGWGSLPTYSRLLHRDKVWRNAGWLPLPGSRCQECKYFRVQKVGAGDGGGSGSSFYGLHCRAKVICSCLSVPTSVRPLSFVRFRKKKNRNEIIFYRQEMGEIGHQYTCRKWEHCPHLLYVCWYIPGFLTTIAAWFFIYGYSWGDRDEIQWWDELKSCIWGADMLKVSFLKILLDSFKK